MKCYVKGKRNELKCFNIIAEISVTMSEIKYIHINSYVMSWIIQVECDQNYILELTSLCARPHIKIRCLIKPALFTCKLIRTQQHTEPPYIPYRKYHVDSKQNIYSKNTICSIHRQQTTTTTKMRRKNWTQSRLTEVSIQISFF